MILSPEVDTYTYAVANQEELAGTLASVLGRSEADVRSALAEGQADPELGPRLTRDLRHRVLWHKARPRLAGHHLSMWVAVRLLKPRIVVETGILDGLGSRVVLRALQLNAEGGHEGRLVSFDVMPAAGFLVPDRLASRWTKAIESSASGLDHHLRDESVEVFLHDSLPEPEHQRFELDWALRHGCRLAVTTQAWTGVAQQLAQQYGARSATHADRPADHFFRGRTIAYIARSFAGSESTR